MEFMVLRVRVLNGCKENGAVYGLLECLRIVKPIGLDINEIYRVCKVWGFRVRGVQGNVHRSPCSKRVRGVNASVQPIA